MQKNHINERGSHTTIIESVGVVVDIFSRLLPGAKIAPGKIERNVQSKSISIKFKQINSELYEMVLVHNGSRQECKLFTSSTFEKIKKILEQNKKTREWNVNYTDMRVAVPPSRNLDEKYSVNSKSKQ